jgi:tripartite-type tricarboxylate transporter receptor subunit TctC
LPAFPDIPTLAESGVAGYAEVTLGTYLVPRGTPIDIVKKLNAELHTALLSLKQEIADRGGYLIANSPEEAAGMLKVEYLRYGKIVKELGIAPQ